MTAPQLRTLSLEEVLALLIPLSFRGIADERGMQMRVEQALLAAGASYQREVVVAGGRIDFAIGAIGLECKVKDPLAALTRQCSAYTDDPRLNAIVVLTTKMAHRGLPDSLGGKPVRVVWCGGGML